MAPAAWGETNVLLAYRFEIVLVAGSFDCESNRILIIFTASGIPGHSKMLSEFVVDQLVTANATFS